MPAYREGRHIVADVLISILLCTMVLLVGFFVLGAYLNLSASNKEITAKAEQMSRSVREMIIDAGVPRKPLEQSRVETIRHLVEEFKSLSRDSTQSNTITFLFTVFSIGLLSGSAYLLERSRKNVEDVEKRLNGLKSDVDETREAAEMSKQQAGIYLENMSTPWKIGADLIHGLIASRQLEYAKDAKNVAALAADLRDWLSSAEEALQQSKADGWTIGEGERQVFHVQSSEIRLQLDKVPAEFQGMLKDVATISDHIIAVLKNSDCVTSENNTPESSRSSNLPREPSRKPPKGKAKDARRKRK
jgi:hypothetical protein